MIDFENYIVDHIW